MKDLAIKPQAKVNGHGDFNEYDAALLKAYQERFGSSAPPNAGQVTATLKKFENVPSFKSLFDEFASKRKASPAVKNGGTAGLIIILWDSHRCLHLQRSASSCQTVRVRKAVRIPTRAMTM